MITLAQIFYNLSIYKTIVYEKFIHSLGRYTLGYLILTLCLALWVNQTYVPSFLAKATSYATQLLDQIPASASATINNNQLTTTNLPANFTLAIDNTPLVSIDQTASSAALASSSAMIAIGGTSMRVPGDTEGSYQIVEYQQSPTENAENATITGEEIHTTVNQILNFPTKYGFSIPLLLLMPIFMFLWIERLGQTIIMALLLKVSSLLFGRKAKFTQFWRITLHTIIIAETISTIILLLYHHTYPYVFTVAYVGSTIIVYLHLPADLDTTKNPVK
jgi:hypothetical protein